MTKHYMVKEKDEQMFIDNMNKVSNENNIFASQTHVVFNQVTGATTFYAIMFGKD